MHIRRVLFFFLANNTEAPQGEVLGLLKPLSNSSYNWTLSAYNSAGAIICGVIEIGDVLWCNSIVKSTSLYRGNPSSSSEKMFSYSQTVQGRPNSCLASSSRVMLASQPINCLFHLESYTAWGKASCLAP